MTLRQRMGILMLFLVGGNDTTRNSMTGRFVGPEPVPRPVRKLREQSGTGEQPGAGDRALADAGDPHAAHGGGQGVEIPPERLILLRAGHAADWNGVRVLPFTIPHDAEDPVAYRIEWGGFHAAVVTDLGQPTALVADHCADLDLLVLEANHDVQMLREGGYPPALKARILSRVGHLSNESMGELLAGVLGPGSSTVVLAHLSEQNNDPALARLPPRRSCATPPPPCTWPARTSLCWLRPPTNSLEDGAMTPKPSLARIVLAASAVCAPLWAQTPLFTDGPAFGGSKVFSEGMNPLGNPARFDQAPRPATTSASWTATSGPRTTSRILTTTSAPRPGAPWASWPTPPGPCAPGPTACQHQERRQPRPDPGGAQFDPGLSGPRRQPGHRSPTTVHGWTGAGPWWTASAWAAAGPGQQGSTTAMGLNLRVERWAMGEIDRALQQPAQVAFPGSAESDLLGATATIDRPGTSAWTPAWCWNWPRACAWALTADQLNPKHLWDVYLQPQFRAGLQLDLGQPAKLSLEGDLNSVERMPFPVKQQSNSASLRFALSLGRGAPGGRRAAEDRRRLRHPGRRRPCRSAPAPCCSPSASRPGQDRPMKSATLMVN